MGGADRGNVVVHRAVGPDGVVPGEDRAMNKEDCIKNFAATWLAARSAAEGEDFDYECYARRALIHADAAWAAIEGAIQSRMMDEAFASRMRETAYVQWMADDERKRVEQQAIEQPTEPTQCEK
jgi:hypothetical protein